jgi:hypothetical protein
MSSPDYVTNVWLFVTTSTTTNANTTAGLQLELALPGQDALLETSPVSNSQQTLNTLGRTAQFHWTPGSKGTVNWTSASFGPSDITSLELEIVGEDSDNAWLPSSVWVLVHSQVSGYQVLSTYPSWPSNQWFSSDPADGTPARPSYQLQILVAD